MNDEITKQNLAYYDKEAEVYDEVRYGSVKGGRVDVFQKKILENYLCELDRGADVLEFGCGTGRFLSHLNKAGYRLTGLDISQGMLSKAAERFHIAQIKNITLVHNDSNSFPFEDESIDAIYSILVINLIENFERIFDEASRTLKPGGIFVFSVPNLSSIYFAAGLYVNMRRKTTTANESGFRYSHWFSRGEISQALDRSGFSLEVVLGQPPLVPYRDSVAPLEQSKSMWLLSKSVYIKARKHSK